MNNDSVAGLQGVDHLKLCVDVTAYWTGSAVAQQDGVLAFYQMAVDLVGQKLARYLRSDMTNFSALDQHAFGLLPDWFRNPHRQDFYSLTFESEQAPGLPSDTALSFWAAENQRLPVGAVRLMLPASFIDRSANPLKELAIELLTKLEFDSAHCGYSINWHYLSRRYAMSAKRVLGFLARRFPGIDLPHMVCALRAIPYGFKRINWLTFLGPRLIERLGTPNSISNQLLNEDAEVDSFGSGMMIRAGNAPGIGDVNRQEALNAYHSVGRALAGARSQRHPYYLLPARGDVDDALTADWLGYFDT